MLPWRAHAQIDMKKLWIICARLDSSRDDGKWSGGGSEYRKDPSSVS